MRSQHDGCASGETGGGFRVSQRRRVLPGTVKESSTEGGGSEGRGGSDLGPLEGEGNRYHLSTDETKKLKGEFATKG